MTKNIEICKAEEVGAQVLDILGTTAERQAVAAINAAFGLAIPLPANEPGEITELPAAVSAHDRQLLAQTLGKPEPAATLSTTDPLATFVATLCRDLYLHFAERQAVYPLADFPDPFARNLAHLLQAVQSLAPRKISNGAATNDGIPDGISLARLIAGDYASVTKLIDDTKGWHWGKSITDIFPNADEMVLGCTSMVDGVLLYVNSHTGASIHLSALKTANQNSNTFSPIRVEKIYLDAFENGWFRLSGSASYANSVTKYLYIGCKGKPTDTIGIYNYNYDTSETHSGVPVTDIEIPQGARQGLIISNSTIVWWPALTRENVRAHIIDRLADNSDGATITIQLGNILDKLTAEDIAVATNKNYNLKRF